MKCDWFEEIETVRATGRKEGHAVTHGNHCPTEETRNAQTACAPLVERAQGPPTLRRAHT